MSSGARTKPSWRYNACAAVISGSEEITTSVGKILTQTDIRDRLKAGMSKLGIEKIGDIGPKEAQALAEIMAEGVSDEVLKNNAQYGGTAEFSEKLLPAAETR